MTHRIAFLILSAALAANAAEIKPESYLNNVKYLASDALKGRATGTPELEKAAKYIAGEFRKAGLKPAGAGGAWLQAFPVTVSARLGKGNLLEVTGSNGKRTQLKTAADFLPYGFSEAGKASGQVVFVGYGITAPELGYDDYAGIDTKDKIVLVLRHEPQEFDEKSKFDGKTLTLHSQFISKATNARIHGARAIILVNDLHQHPSGQEGLDDFTKTAGPANAGMPFVQVKASVAEAWLKDAGKDLRAAAEGIDKDLQPRSFALSIEAHIATDLARITKTAHNVAGYLPGDTDEYVVIGAHYDHLGLGDNHSLAPSQIGQVHHGADDNASGTSGVIELAKWFGLQPKQKRGILFLTFAGEELGLLGSSYYVANPLKPLDKAVTMVNMDMIGRIRDNRVFLSGSGTGSTFKALLDGTKDTHGLRLDLSEQGGYGSSDHTSFTTKRVPTLFFFSGLHGDYHKPSDTADKIDATGAAHVLDLVADLATKLASSENRPEFVRVVDPRPQAPASSSGGGGGYGPAFGSIPDFNEPPKGVRFADVRDGTPAQKAGLKPGDILIEFDGKEVKNLTDFTYLLRTKKPGETVLVKVLRGDQTIEAKVLLTERR